MKWFIDSNAEEILRNFASLPERSQTAVKNSLSRSLLVMEKTVMQRTGVRWRRGDKGLKGRLTSRVGRRTDGSVDGIIGFRKTRGFPYELSQEYGARAKPGKAMAMPISDEARAANGPRTMDKLFVFKNKARAYLVRSTAKGRLEFHYLLLKKIEPKLNFRRTVKEEIPGLLSDIEKDFRKSLTS